MSDKIVQGLREAVEYAKSDRRNADCSFCGLLAREVEVLVKGPSVRICDSCVDICVDIIREERVRNAGPHRAGELEYLSWGVTP